MQKIVLFVCVYQAGILTAHLIMWRGTIPHNTYRSSTVVGLRHPKMAMQAVFRTGSVFGAYAMICSRLRTHTQQWRNRGCGADSSGVCSPVGVRQLIMDAVPGSGFALVLAM